MPEEISGSKRSWSAVALVNPCRGRTPCFAAQPRLGGEVCRLLRQQKMTTPRQRLVGSNSASPLGPLISSFSSSTPPSSTPSAGAAFAVVPVSGTHPTPESHPCKIQRTQVTSDRIQESHPAKIQRPVTSEWSHPQTHPDKIQSLPGASPTCERPQTVIQTLFLILSRQKIF